MSAFAHPRIAITVAQPDLKADPALTARKNELYAEAIARHGAVPTLLDQAASPSERATILAEMDGLLLSGGADLDPALYGEASRGSRDVEAERDTLEAEAWAGAERRQVPVLGICRGLQMINVLAGGRLLQDVPGHIGAPYGHGPALQHEITLVPETRLARLLGVDRAKLVVNSYHHQAVRSADLAPALTASAWADSEAGQLVEGLELPGDRFVVAVQCHPERTESSPLDMKRLWVGFVEAARDVARLPARHSRHEVSGARP